MAIFEPRTNTTRRSVFQQEYALSFDSADVIAIAAVDHPERAPDGQRFDVLKLVADLCGRGLDARYLPSVDHIVAVARREARSGDVLLVMSNGAFGGIHRRILDALTSQVTRSIG